MNFLEITLLGAGLATDASCVSTTNGLTYNPKLKETIKIALTFGLFQFAMPILGFLGASLLPKFIYQYNHIIAFLLLAFIGGKMIIEVIKGEGCTACQSKGNPLNPFTNQLLFAQGVATSIDALSVGFAFSGMDVVQVINASALIAVVTFIMCFAFVKVGVCIGDKLNTKAELVGGIVLVSLGIKMLF